MRCGFLVLLLVVGCREKPSPAPVPRLVPLWTFEAPEPGASVAAPLATPRGVFFAAVHQRGFRLSGALYALDPETGKRRWTFDRDGDMLPTASSPVLVGDQLLLGEGMHANFVCQMHSVDPETGKLNWIYQTNDHIEGGAVAADGLIYFPAGNDGIIALNAAGQRRWNFHADLHTDSTPFVAEGRLYFGSGASRRFRESYVVCLDAKTGEAIWRTPVTLPAWGPPVIANGRVFVGCGNGRLMEPAQAPEKPAGSLLCLNAVNGELLWTFPVPDAVFTQPVILNDRVVFGSRDGHLYGVSFGGTEVFRVHLGGPVMASPVQDGSHVVAVSVPGRIVCVSALGHEQWRHELRRGQVLVYAPPRIAGRRLFVGAETKAGTAGVVSLSCFHLPEVGSP
jgi:outer membrane protein assembly factor BamB